MTDDNLLFATQLANQTGKLLLGYYQNPQLASSHKSDKSLVTEADLMADQLISSTIRNKFPEDIQLSEEIHPNYPEVSDDSVWIIDPLDGTTNFSLGIHYWGILITHLNSGSPDFTVQYFPAIDELFVAKKDQGAHLNGKRLFINEVNNENTSSFFSCCSRTFRNYHVTIPYKTRVFGSAAYSMSCVARGIACIAFEAQAKIWDVAGSWLLVSEAGGKIAPHEGGALFPLIPGKDYSIHNFPIIAAISSNHLIRGCRQIRRKK